MSVIPGDIAGDISIHFFVVSAGDLAPDRNSGVSIMTGCPQGES